MKGLKELAHQVIDTVEARLREFYPDIEAMASQVEENTLLVGENYYALEDEVVEQLFDFLEKHLLRKAGFEMRWYKGKQLVIMSRAKLPLKSRFCIWVEEPKFSNVPVRLLWRKPK